MVRPRVVGVGMLAMLTGCSVVPQRAHSPDLALAGETGECARLFERVDDAVGAAGVRDGGSFPIASFPYLRANRFLASFRDEVDDPAAARAWTERLQALDAQARRVELRRLPAPARQRLGAALPARIESCGDLLRQRDLALPQRLAALRAAATVPDEYVEWQRVAGLYPISRWFVLRGVDRWQAEARKEFAYAPRDYPRQVIYAPADPAPPPPAALRRDALGIPRLSPEGARRLLAAHAPAWQVEQGGGYDRIGQPRSPGPQFDAAQPVVFGQISFTRFDGAVLPQLSYWAWFSERPAEGAFDLVAGRLDSVILRVTLDLDGRPLLYDSIHGCGCWQQFFPSDRLTARRPPANAEPPLVFGPAPEAGAGERLVVALASGSHFIEALYFAAAPLADERYALRPYVELLESGPAGAPGLFGPDGIAPGTERLERYVLWPMAIPQPGASRQWGRHATAFVGERQFDDPDLIQRLFRRLTQPSSRQGDK